MILFMVPSSLAADSGARMAKGPPEGGPFNL